MRVIIVGAGIGGLATALSLHKTGFTDVTLLESAAEIQPLGVGINLLPHAVRELTELGLDAELESIGVRTNSLRYVNEFGSTIWSETRGIAAGYEWPQYSIHRGLLQVMLADKVRERLGTQAIVTGARVISVDTDGVSGTVTTALGTFTGDVVVAADGIRSTVRAQWHPLEGDPIWNHQVMWRGTTRTKPFLDAHTMIMAGHMQKKFVAYPISPVGADGMQLINWIAEQTDPTAEDLQHNWNREVHTSRFAFLFASWNFDWLNVPGLIAQTDSVYEYPMSDRDPLNNWIDGRVVLLGDAAHPTFPIGSNGSSQAIIDSRVLAYALATMPNDEALAFYQHERLPKTTALQQANRQMGPEAILQLAHERAPHGFTAIHDVIPQEELEQVASHYKVVAGFDPRALSIRPSWDAPTNFR